MPSPYNKRFYIVLALLLLAVSSIVVRLFQLQVGEHRDLIEMRDALSLNEATLLAERGRIYDQAGIILAMDEPAVTIYVEPQKVYDRQRVAEHLQQVTGIQHEKILKRLESKALVNLIARQLSFELKNALEKESLPGVFYTIEKRRFYPYGELACHVLGFVGIEHHGMESLEFLYDRLLRGTDGKIRQYVDAFRMPLRRSPLESISAINGRDLHLTLSKPIQEIAEQVLGGLASKHKMDEGTIIMMNAYSGNVTAMASYPSYDANNYRDFTNSDPKVVFSYPAIRDLIESDPLLLILLQGELLAQSDIAASEGYRYETKTHNLPSISSANARDTLRRYARLLGKDRLATFARHWELDKETGVELRAHGTAILQLDSILQNGHGLYLTPIQLARVLAGIVNGGNLIRPILVKPSEAREFNSNGRALTGQKVMLTGIAHTLKQALKDNVLRGEAKAVQIFGYNMGGIAYSFEDHRSIGGGGFVGFVSWGDLREESVIVVIVKRQGLAKSRRLQLAMGCYRDFCMRMLENEEAVGERH